MINKTELLPKFKMVREQSELRKRTESIKSTQLVGGDSIVVEGTALATASVTLAANTSTAYIVTFTPSLQILMNVDLYVSVYVDTDNDANLLWPAGASLTSAQKKLRRSLTPDWAASSDSTGVRVFVFSLENYDTVSHTYYIKFKTYAPKNPAATS